MSEVLYIYGASGLGREVAQLVEDINAEDEGWVCRFLDDDPEKHGKWISGYEVVGDWRAVADQGASANVAIAIANPVQKRALAARLTGLGVKFPTLIHPKAYVSSRSVIGSGTIIQASCTLSVENRVGNFVFLNFGVVVGHDVIVSDYCSLMTGTVLSGGVVLGEAVYTGTGAIILPSVTLGAECIVGAGATVIRNVQPKQTVGGIPAKPLH